MKWNLWIILGAAYLLTSGLPSVQARDYHGDDNFGSYSVFPGDRIRRDGPGTGGGAYATDPCSIRGATGEAGGLSNDGPTLFQQTCVRCHSGLSQSGGTIVKGDGTTVFVGPSEMVSAIQSQKMPKGTKLTDTQRQALITLIGG